MQTLETSNSSYRTANIAFGPCDQNPPCEWTPLCIQIPYLAFQTVTFPSNVPSVPVIGQAKNEVFLSLVDRSCRDAIT